jgi:hypothetical protein
MKLEITKENILENLIEESYNSYYLFTHSFMFSDKNNKVFKDNQQLWLDRFLNIYNSDPFRKLDELILFDYDKVIMVLNLTTQRLIKSVLILKSNGNNSETEKSFINIVKTYVYDLDFNYSLNRSYIEQLFTKKEIKEKQTIKRDFLTDKQKELITLLLNKGYKDSHIFRYLVEEVRFIDLSESSYIEYLNNEQNANYKPSKRFTQLKDLQIRQELKETFNDWRKNNL